MLFGILMWIVISLVPLQTSPEFVVHEIEACCHHRIALQCSGDEHMKIVVVQARYVIDQEEQIPAPASSSHPHYQIPALEHNATVAIPRPSASASDNQPLPRNPRTISLWDLDIKFVHDLINENLPHPVHINAPPWHSSHISHFADKQRFHYPRVTIPPIFYKHGLNFTSSRVIEMPPYHLKFLDKDTIWREPLFSIGQSESSIMSSNSYVPYKKVGNVGGSVGKRSHHQQPRPNEQVPSTETNTESGAYDYDDQQGNGECWSYEALSSTSATFTTDSSKIKPPWHFKDLRAYFNQRCSGRSKCTVELVRGNQPDPDVTKLCHLLPEGKVTVKYLCYNSSSEDVHSRCNVDVMPAKEGFLHNPGYPDLYPGDEPCQWRLHVPQQKILLVFFDISLRGQEKSTCRDKLVASEEHSKLLSTCGDHSSAVAVLSESHKLNVTLIPQSRLAFPKRGFLIYYRVLGCRDPVRPKNSYVVFRNATHAYIICDLGHLNPDTLTRERWLYCNPLEHTWTGTILDCQDVRSYSNTMRNLSIAQVLRNDPSVWPVKLRPKENVMSDFIIPICVIISLFFINGIILFFICRARRRLEEMENERNQEMEEICAVGLESNSPVDESTFSFPSSAAEDLWHDHFDDDIDETDQDRTLTTLTLHTTSTPPDSAATKHENRSGNGYYRMSQDGSSSGIFSNNGTSYYTLRQYSNGPPLTLTNGNGLPLSNQGGGISGIGNGNGGLLPTSHQYFTGYTRTTAV